MGSRGMLGCWHSGPQLGADGQMWAHTSLVTPKGLVLSAFGGHGSILFSKVEMASGYMSRTRTARFSR
jgi:hypothetical protein